MRATGADAADADAEQAAASGAAAAGAAVTPGVEGLARTGSGVAPGSGRKQQPPRSPRGQDPEASEDVPLITCSSSATLLEVGFQSCHSVNSHYMCRLFYSLYRRADCGCWNLASSAGFYADCWW
jgi:hypothetical protein